VPRPPKEGICFVCRTVALVAILLALVAPGFSGPTVGGATSHPSASDASGASSEAVSYPSKIEDELGPLITGDYFNTLPIGFNSALWDFSTFGNPSLAWEDAERFVLHTSMWQYSILKTKVMTGPEVIADFNVTFSGGLCYFGIGWSDRLWEPGSEWVTNLRLSDNGVFIDYWDNELYLVSCFNGTRVAAHIPSIDVTLWHHFRLCWSESLVRLEVDDLLCAFVSCSIPSCPLPFVITTSGHHNRVQSDQLRLEDVRLFSRVREPMADDPQIVLLWPGNKSTVYTTDLVDLQVDGSDGALVCSWDDDANSSITSPWDIPVPSVPGIHDLTLSSRTEGGVWRTRSLRIEVEEQITGLGIPVTEASFIIDGVVEGVEKGWTREFKALFRNEARDEVTISLYVGSTSEALYVGLGSHLPDRWNTRIALLVDGEGDGFWKTLSVSPPRDFAVCVGAPAADTRFEKESLTTPSGVVFSRSLLPGLTYDSDVKDGVVSAEFLIPLAAIGANSSSALGFGLKLSEGGQDWCFPAWYSSTSPPHLPLVHPSPLNAEVPVLLWAATALGLAGVWILGVHTLMRSRYTSGTHGGVPPMSERQERVLVLLESHPVLSIERLGALAGLDLPSARKTLQELNRLGFMNGRIEVSGDMIIRRLRWAGKTEKEESL